MNIYFEETQFYKRVTLRQTAGSGARSIDFDERIDVFCRHFI